MEKDNLIIALNVSETGSSGNIMINALNYANKFGDFDYFVMTPNGEDTRTHYNYNVNKSPLFRFKYFLLYRIFKRTLVDGNYFIENTRKIIKRIKLISKPYKKVIIHLHTLHNAQIHINSLYKFLAKNNFPVIYTFHDCWPFTGGCYCYEHIKCKNWIKQCAACKQYIPHSKTNLSARCGLLNKIRNLTVCTVSNWLENEVEQSRLHPKKVVTIYGETNINIVSFDRNEFRKQLGIKNEHIVLSVSSYWNEWKGISYIKKIADNLPIDYKLLVVGGNLNYKNIVHFNNLNYNELSKFYSLADVYLSTAQAEALGLTTCEAQIHGCPIIGFGNCGSKETFNGKTGLIVNQDDINSIINSIKFICENKPFNKADIIQNGDRFKKYSNSSKYLILYNDLAKE